MPPADRAGDEPAGLGLAVEQLCPIAPLPVPSPDQRSDLDVVPAVALFVKRAASARQGFQPDDEDLATVAGIVRRLDGIPLAIELAAGRLAAMGLQDVATRGWTAPSICSPPHPTGPTGGTPRCGPPSSGPMTC